MLPVIVIVPFSCDRISFVACPKHSRQFTEGALCCRSTKGCHVLGSELWGSWCLRGLSPREGDRTTRRGSDDDRILRRKRESDPCRFRRFATEVEGPASIGKSRGQPDTGTLWSSLKQRSSCAWLRRRGTHVPHPPQLLPQSVLQQAPFASASGVQQAISSSPHGALQVMPWLQQILKPPLVQHSMPS